MNWGRWVHQRGVNSHNAMKCKQLAIRYQCMKRFSPQKVDRKLVFLARTLRLHLKTLTPKKNYIDRPLARSCVTQFKVDRPQTTVVAKNLSVLQLFISRMPKMCAILQLVSAPLNPIPIAEHFRRSHPQCEYSCEQHIYMSKENNAKQNEDVI